MAPRPRRRRDPRQGDPRAGRDAIEGVVTLSDGQGALKVRVRAVPEDGAANEAMRRLLADRLGLPVSDVRLIGGGAARFKTFQVAGDAEDLIGRLTTQFGPRV